MARLRAMIESRRALAGRLAFEFLVIFVGVTAAFALEGWREGREENRYRETMIAAMVPTFDDVVSHNREFLDEVKPRLAAFDRDLAAGKQPLLPIYRERGAELPPVRAWDGIVASGVSKALPPDLYFELSQFYNRQESAGRRYIRYAEVTEQDIDTLGPDQRGIYAADGTLKPQYAAYVDRLRDFVGLYEQIDAQARDLKAKVQALG